MAIRQSIQHRLFLAVLLFGVVPATISAEEQPWNLIAIVTDDQGEWALGAYGNSEIVTPAMDRLAAEGARFTHAFAASGVCTPARAAYLTGLFPSQVGLQDVAYADPDQGLSAGVPSWPRVLREHGYRTGLVGKWHLGRTDEHHPRNFGIDYFFGFLGGANRTMDPVLRRGDEVSVVPGPTGDVLVDDAIDFVGRNRARPFALMLHFRAPHAPHGPVPPADTAPLAGLDARVPVVDPEEAVLDDDQEPADPAAIALHRELLAAKMKTYYASIHSIDRNLGRLLATLEEMDLAKRTIVLFTSDHGYMFGHRGLKGKGAAQPIRNHTLADNVALIHMYDAAMRVPLLVRWPGVVRPGTVIDALVSHVDIFPSVLGMLGIAEAASAGRDFSPLLRGEKIAWRETLFAQYTPDQIGFMSFIRMARTHRWKLVRRYVGQGGNQLFDLLADPEEKHNLYHADIRRLRLEQDVGQKRRMAEHPYREILARLQAEMTAWQRSIGDPALELDEIYSRETRKARQRWQ